MSEVKELFGSMVFNRAVMKARLPKETYRKLQQTIRLGLDLEPGVADIVANAMKDWAVEKGATHYTHWFQPMTGITAEKHDGFLSPCSDGSIILEFSGKELIKGEPDASSFPSGGLRATFEARGYTAWDPTSPAFIKDHTLYIPTAFCSYGGEALDKKTPLLRSMEAINTQALRVLKLFGRTEVTRVAPTVGPEQEYFLIDEELFKLRPDIRFTGRTLFGSRPPKGQELEDHYFGAIKPRIAAYMQDLDVELWKLGVLAKTEHNEVAPAQHELAPIFTDTNVATDHNQLTMELMQKVAKRHGLVCLLHEKPFAGVNGSGKHNNWSLATDTGMNLLDPGKSPIDNKQFLLFLAAVIKAVDEYQDLLRITVASAGNDHRLGANEAPPAIVSIFLGDELMDVVEAIEKDAGYLAHKKGEMGIGVRVLPPIPKDSTDRNRTSPFAFTGNKFEFRMPGSSFSIAGPNYVINTIVAESLAVFADALEAATDFDAALAKLVRDTFIAHKRILFNGNNYADEWVVEAEKRGLLNLKSTVEALPCLVADKNVALFQKHCVLTEKEIHARYEIALENYIKVISIEAITTLDLARKKILPAVSAYAGKLVETALAKNSIGVNSDVEKALAGKISDLCAKLYAAIEALDAALAHEGNGGTLKHATYCHSTIIPAMNAVREAADALELITAESYWPLPSYSKLLFEV